jgi:hypothetical protein
MAQAPYRDDLASVVARADRLAEENAQLRLRLAEGSAASAAASRKRLASKVRKLVRVTLPGLFLVAMAMTLQSMFLHTYVSGSVHPTQSDSGNHTKLSLLMIRQAAEVYRVDHLDECPMPERLKTAHLLSASSLLHDPWGTPYAISCTEDETMASSAGPDRRWGTADDIVVPQQGLDSRLTR